MVKTLSGNKEDVERQAVSILTKILNALCEKKDKVVIGIPGGRSVQGIFSLLTDADIPWEKIHIFLVDERFVSIDSDESNFKGIKEAFVDGLTSNGTLPSENVHSFMYDETLKDGGVSLYEKEFFSVADSFDAIILGSGEDGHVASLFPDHASVHDDHDGFVHVTQSPKPPSDRISASRTLLQKTDCAFVLFFGSGKKQAYEQFIDEASDVAHCPATLVYAIKEAYVLTDVA